MNQLIKTIQSIVDLNSGEIDIIKLLWEEQSIKKGDFFLSEGKICKQVGFVQEGLLRYFINHDGEEKNYDFAREGDFICNYESFIPQTPSTKNIQALEDCNILRISYHKLQELYKSVQQGERFGRLVAEQVFIQTLQNLSSFYTDTPELRYKTFVENHANLQQRISQYHIASYVGVKQQSLSRIRKRISQ